MTTLARLALLGAVALSACERTPAPDAARLALEVRALSLSGVKDALWDIQVVNGASTPEVVWERRVSASTFGDGVGSVTYVGPCDAAPGVETNTVRVWLVGLYDSPVPTAQQGAFAAGQTSGAGTVGMSPVSFVSPTATSPMVRTAVCSPNADTPVAFDVTIMRPATQGFFDIAVSFNDIFCSAKFDCCYDRNGDGCDPTGAEDIELLFDASGARAKTFVLGLACTAGAAADVVTDLYLDALELDCDLGSDPQAFLADLTIDPSLGAPGNLCVAGEASTCSAITPASGVDPDVYLYQVASYVGREALTSGGVSAQKVFWNVALGVNGPIAGCRLRTRATAEDAATASDLVVNGTIAAGTIYPTIEVDVPLGACGSHPLGFGPDGGPVRTVYTDGTATSFAFHFGASSTPGAFCSPACVNGGACVDGACDCTGTSFTGPTCATPICPPGHLLDGGTCVPTLSGLASSAGALAPAFTTTTRSYRVDVANEVDTIRFTPTATAGIGITVAGAPTASGTASSPIPLSVGDNPIAVVATSTTSRTYDVLVVRAPDTTAPDAPTITSPAASPYAANTPALALTGTCEPGASVTASGAGAPVSTPCDTGTFNLSLSGAFDGTFAITVTQRDAAGNTSLAANLTWVRDTTAPSAPTITSPASNPAWTASSLVPVAGTCEVSAEVEVTGDTSELIPCLDGTFTFDAVVLANGTFEYAIAQRDTVGNVSATATLTIHRDDTLPESPIITDPAITPRYTNGSALTLTGSCTTGFTVYLQGASTQSTTCANATFTFTVNAATDDTRVYQLRQENPLTLLVSSASTFTWVRDTAAPAPPSLTSPADDPHWSANDTLTIAGTCEPDAVVALSGDETASTPCSGGTFTFIVTRTTNGTWDFAVTQTDRAANTSATTAVQWTRDTTEPPAPTITSHASPHDANTSTVILSGTCLSGYPVTLSGAATDEVTCANSVFTFTLAAATDGERTFFIHQTHPLTFVESARSSFVWRRDTLSPEPVTFTAPTNNPYTSGDDAFSLEGTCEPAATVELVGAQTATTTCTAGTFQFLLAQGVDGTHAYTVRQIDAAHNASAGRAFTWHRDTTIPPTPLLSSPGTTPFRSNTNTLTLTGSCEGSNDVELSGADTQTAVCSGGAFSFSVTAATDGQRTYTILQRSTANGFASASATQVWVRDTVAPSPPVRTSPTSSPHYTGDLSLTLSGTCDTDSLVRLAGAQTGSATCAANTFSFALTAANSGTRDYTLSAEDDVGNVSAPTSFRWIADTTVPSAPLVTSPASSPFYSAQSSLTLSGTCTTNFIVYLQGASTQTATCLNGAFAFTIAAATDDTYTYSLFQESNTTGLTSGNTSFTWVRDTTEPDEVTITSPPTNPYFSGDDTIIIGGGCEPGTIVSIATAATGTTPCVNGQYSFAITRSVDTTYNFHLSQADMAGNASLPVLFQWVRDTSIPASPTITSPTSPHYSSTNGITLNGTCTSGYTVTLSGASNQTQTCTAGAFSFSLSAATDASRTYSVKQTSLSAIDSSSVSLTWVRDTVAPAAPTITAPSTNPYTSGDTTFALQGACELNATVTLAGAQAGTLTCTSGTYRFDLTKSVDGTYDYTLQQRDRALNTSATTSFRWIRNVTIPATPVLSSPSPNPYTSNGSSVTVAGSCTGANTVNVTGANTTSATCSGGAFSFAFNKSTDGTYNWTITQVSSANGFSSSSVTATWTRDTVAPSAPTLTSIAPTSPSANPNPKVVGTASGDTTTIQLFRTSNCSGATATSGTVANFTGVGLSVAALSQQTMSVSARALDLAGNPSACSATSLAYTHRAPQLVKDINLSGNGASSPSQFAQIGTKLYFRATNGVAGDELFISDGTANGTTMLKDINPADSSSPAAFVAFQGKAYFSANDGDNGAELWVSDGTANGTTLLKDINPGPNSSSPTNFLAVGTTLYFTADDGETGTELWKTDGTANGTVLVADIEPGFTGSSPSQLKAVGSVIVFRATTTNEGIELWRSGGTAATTWVFDLNAGTLNSSPNYLVNMGSYVYFSATEAATGNELWRTNGTTTTRMTDLYEGATSSSPSYLTVLGSTIYMYARQFSTNPAISNLGYELYKWTEAGGAVLVKDIYTGGSNAGSPVYITALDSTRIVFRATTAASGTEPWVSDGTAAGTFQLAETNPGVLNSGMSIPVVAGGRAYFTAVTNGETELWATDGTVAGTVRYDINPGSNSSSPSSLAVFNDKLIASVHTIATGREPFLVDSAGPRLLADLNLIPSSTPGSFIQFGSNLYFAADDGVTGRELWRTDGTAAGTVLVADINPGAGHSGPAGFAVLGSSLFFRADDGDNGLELWKTNGTTTSLVTDICPGDGPSTPNYLVSLGSQLLFSADDCTNGIELWQATEAGGATLVKNIHTTANTSSSPVLLTVMGTRVYMRATDGTNGAELYATDGTTAGTVLVKNVRSGSTSSTPSNLTVVGGNKLFFTATDTASTGTELYVSDGTTAGTVLVADLNPGLLNSSPGNLRDLNGLLLFSATTSTLGNELYSSTGAGNAVLVKDIRAGVGSSSPTTPMVLGTRMYFRAFDDAGGAELWVTDGSTANTVRLADLRPGPASSNPTNFFAIDASSFFFTANEGVNGTEPWRSNTTAAGTYLIQDINLLGPSWGGAALVINGVVYFSANDGTNGFELWKY